MTNGKVPAVRVIDAMGLGAAAALTGAAWLFAVGPAMSSGDKARVTAASVARRDAELREAVQSRTDAERLSVKLQQELEASVTLLPTSRLNERLAALSALCERQGVRVNELTPGAPTPSKQHVRVVVKLSGSANWAQGVGLIAALAREFRDTAVTAFKLRGDPTRPDDRSEFSLEIVWHAASGGYAGAPTQP